MDPLERHANRVRDRASQAIGTAHQKYDVEEIAAEELIGRTVTFILRPELTAQITAVHIFRAGRTISVAYFEDNESKSLDCDGFQLQLIED